MPLLLNPAFLPILDDQVVNLRLFQFTQEVFISMQLKVLCHLGGLGVFVKKCNFLKTVNRSLQIGLCYAHNLSRFSFQILAVPQTQLVVCVVEIKSAAVDIYWGDVFNIAQGFGNFRNSLEMQVNLDERLQVGELLVLLIGSCGRAARLGFFICLRGFFFNRHC